MRIDVYTKFVLTVIAVCLIWLSLRDSALLPIVQAQAERTAVSGYNRVVIAGWLDNKGHEHPFVGMTAGDPGIPVAVVSDPTH
jgi:hypothetical protein